MKDTSTRYLQAKLDFSTVIENVYNYNGREVSKVKHQVSPFLTFSNIPWIQQDGRHPFHIQLQKRADGLFDQFDVVPMSNDTDFMRYPMGKSLYYGLSSRVIRKKRPEEEIPKAYPYDIPRPKRKKKIPEPMNRLQELRLLRDKRWEEFNPHFENYEEIWMVNLSQAYDFKAAEKYADKKRAFSYLLATSNFSLDRFSNSFEYKYFPRVFRKADGETPEEIQSNRRYFSSSISWEFQKLQNLKKTRTYSRSISLKYTNSTLPYSGSHSVGGTFDWSYNDLMNTKLEYRYDFLSEMQVGWSIANTFIHPSECWGVMARYDWSPSSSTGNRGNFGFQFLLNLMGTGFSGPDQLQNQGPLGTVGGLGI